MGRIIYKVGDAVEDSNDPIVHACNCQRSWGAGIAKQLRLKYPEVYAKYYKFERPKPGKVIELATDNRSILCLHTSGGYGYRRHDPTAILEFTRQSLQELSALVCGLSELDLVSPKINAGLFTTPWEATEELIEEFLEVNPNVTWTVYTLPEVK